MASNDFSWINIFYRFIFAVVLVYATYNPSGYSFFHWLTLADERTSTIIIAQALMGLTLLIGWIIFLRAALGSIGIVGLVLATLFFSLLFWLIIDLLGLKNSSTMLQYLVLTIISLVLAIGMSWGHVRRRLSGQYSTDDIEE